MSSIKSPSRGRPPKSGDEKRIQVNVRLRVKDRDKLQELATISGKPAAAEAEKILAKSLSRSKETNELLDKIADEIEALELKGRGKWHKNLLPWAAVSEMLAKVLDDYRPERISDDEIVQEIRERLVIAERMRFVAISFLDKRGISVKTDPRPEPMLGLRRRGLFGALQPKPQSPRTWERAAIEAIPDQELKQECLFFFSEVEKQDNIIEAIEAEETAAIMPYLEAEQAGRRLVSPPNAMLQHMPEINTYRTGRGTTLAEALAQAARFENDPKDL